MLNKTVDAVGTFYVAEGVERTYCTLDTSKYVKALVQITAPPALVY